MSNPTVNFLLYKKYYFIRKNYLDNCLSDLKDFIEDIHKNYKKYEK